MISLVLFLCCCLFVSATRVYSSRIYFSSRVPREWRKNHKTVVLCLCFTTRSSSLFEAGRILYLTAICSSVLWRRPLQLTYYWTRTTNRGCLLQLITLITWLSDLDILFIQPIVVQFGLVPHCFSWAQIAQINQFATIVYHINTMVVWTQE